MGYRQHFQQISNEKDFSVIFLLGIHFLLNAQTDSLYKVRIDSVSHISSDSVIVLKVTFVNNSDSKVIIANSDHHRIGKYLFWIPLKWDIIIKYKEELCLIDGRFIHISKDTRDAERTINIRQSYSFDIPINLNMLHCVQPIYPIKDNFSLYIQLKINLYNPVMEDVTSYNFELYFCNQSESYY